MTRHIKRGADIARAVGVALVFVAAVLSIYITASIGKPWAQFSAALHDSGVETDFGARLSFDGAYYRALSRAAADGKLAAEARAARVRPCFSAFEAQAERAEAAERAEQIERAWAWFDAEFDAQAFLSSHAQSENGQDARELKEIFEYLDGLAPAPGKGKAAKLKAASAAPWFESAYAAFAAEQGDAAGSYLDYMRAVRRMIEDWIAAGNTIKDVKAWMSENFTPEKYAEARAGLSPEGNAGTSDGVSDRVAAAIEGGSSAEEALRGIWAELSAETPALDELAFLNSAKALLNDPDYDGTVKTLVERAAAEAKALQASGFSAFMDKWCPQVVAEADDRAVVGVVAPFWRVVSMFAALWIVGVALIVAGVIANALLSRRMLARIDGGGRREDPDALLRVDHLCQYFKSGGQITRAVDDVSFFVRRGEVFGLVGESGCGKTTTGRTVINLYDPTAGDVYFDGLRVSSCMNGLPALSFALRRDAGAKLEALRDAMKAQVAQNPGDAARLKTEYRQAAGAIRRELSDKLAKAQDDALISEAEKRRASELYRQRRRAKLTAEYEAEAAKLTGAALSERRRRYRREMKAAAQENVMTRMQMIFQDPVASIDPRMTVREIIAEGLRIRGVKDKAVIDQKVYEMLDRVGLVPEHADRYPHEFSGGQRQRIGIARAIALEPELIIADEPISALDVSIQAQIINLLNDLRREMGLTLVFIAHNLSVVKYFSDRIAVMYFGKIVEMAASEELFEHPLHPYTKSLLSAIPCPDPYYEKRRKRLEYNPLRAHDYAADAPELREVAPGHWVHCNATEFAAYRRELGL